MDNGTSVLFDLPGFEVVQCWEDGSGSRSLLIMSCRIEHACTGCGLVQTGRVHDHRLSRLKDLPFGPRGLEVWWRKRRFRCIGGGCGRVFTETSEQVGPRRRLTRRLRRRLESSVSSSVRSCADVAREYGVSDWSVDAALREREVELAAEQSARDAAIVAAAEAVAVAVARGIDDLDGYPADDGVDLGRVARLGLDETRARSVRFFRDEHQQWRRTDPWMTSFVDLDCAHPRWLLGLAPGRSGDVVVAWLESLPQAWRDGIKIVALDPSAPFVRVLPHLLDAVRPGVLSVRRVESCSS